jgi:hypothetical protein
MRTSKTPPSLVSRYFMSSRDAPVPLRSLPPERPSPTKNAPKHAAGDRRPPGLKRAIGGPLAKSSADAFRNCHARSLIGQAISIEDRVRQPRPFLLRPLDLPFIAAPHNLHFGARSPPRVDLAR